MFRPSRQRKSGILPTVDATTRVTNSPSIDLEDIGPQDIGLPADGLWDQEGAYDERLCDSHGETEYLLRPSDRWMRPSDFHIDAQLKLDALFEEPGADLDALFQEGQAEIRALCARTEAELDALFQEFKSQPPQFQADNPRCQADCGDDLRSQVLNVVQVVCRGGEKMYLPQWKAIWTRKSCIDDIGWVLESLAAKKELRGTQASVRGKGFS